MQQDMRYIYEVYKEGSFSKAAQKLYLTQPTLSIAIRKIEEQYGMPLFDRSTKPLKLTDAGALYIQKIKEIMALEEELACQINDLSSLKSGHIRIGGTQYFNSYVLPSVLEQFALQYPGVRIELREDTSAGIGQLLSDGSVDLMFSVNDMDESLFDLKPVFKDELLLAVPGQFPVNGPLVSYALTRGQIMKNLHLVKDCPCVPLNAFCDTPFLVLTEGNNLHKRALLICKEAGFVPKIHMEIEQLVTSYHLAGAGLGAAFATSLLIKGSIDYGLSYYKIKSDHASRSFNAVVKKSSYTSRAVQAFIGIVERTYA